MLTQITQKINKFYISLVLLGIAMCIMVIFVLTNIFGSINRANEVDQKVLEGSSVHVIESKIKSAEDAIDQKQSTPLDLH